MSQSTQILFKLPYAKRTGNFYGEKSIPKIEMFVFDEVKQEFLTLEMPEDRQTSPYFITDNVETIASDSCIQRIEDIVKYSPLLFKDVNLKKVVVISPTDVYNGRNNPPTGLRTLVKNWWEGDIEYRTTVLWDSGYTFGLPLNFVVPKFERAMDIKAFIKDFFKKVAYFPFPNMKKMALDIENLKGYADAEKAEKDVACCSIVDNGSLIMLATSQKIDKPCYGKSMFKDSIGISHEYLAYLYPTVKEMVLEIFKYIWKNNVVVTFSGDEFDLLYLRNFAIRLGIDEEKIPIVVEKSEFRTVCSLKRGIHIDLYRLFRSGVTQYSYPEQPRTVNLNEVARITIGKTKLESPDFQNIDKYLLDYCMNDGYITYEVLFSKNEALFKMLFVLMRIYNIGMEDLCRNRLSGLNERLFKYMHRKLDFLIPNPIELDNKSKLLGFDVVKIREEFKKTKKRKASYKGAFTLSIPGVYFDIDVDDYSSLYPGTIDKYNLGYDTIGCTHEECKTNRVPENNFHVCTKTKSIVSAMYGALRDVRLEFKAKKDDLSVVVTGGFKICMLSGYGIFGALFASICFLPLASSITAFSRQAIHTALDIIATHKVEVKHSDTDSLFIKRLSDEEREKFFREVYEKTQIEIVLDKHYKFIVVSKKKNYLGVKDKNPKRSNELIEEIKQIKSILNEKRDLK